MDKFNQEIFKNIGTPDVGDALRRGDTEGAISSLPPETAAKIREVIADREAAEKLLKSPAAQQIMKMLFKDK